MKLYHSSDVSVPVPDTEHSRDFLDFGKGFYLSDNPQQAYELAKIRAEMSGQKPIVNRFEVDDNILLNTQGLKIKIFNDYSEEWAEFVLNNRDGRTTQQFDIVYGPIANDKVGIQIRLLKGRYIDRSEFLKRLKYMKGVTFQYYFGTTEAIQKLKKIH